MVTTSSCRTVLRPRTSSGTTWPFLPSSQLKCCKQTHQLLPSGSLIQPMTSMATTQQDQTSMESGMKSKLTLMGLQLPMTSVLWVILLATFTTTQHIPICDSVCVSSNSSHESILAVLYVTIATPMTLGLTILPVLPLTATSLSTKICKMVFWLNKLETFSSIDSLLDRTIFQELNSGWAISLKLLLE